MVIAIGMVDSLYARLDSVPKVLILSGKLLEGLDLSMAGVCWEQLHVVDTFVGYFQRTLMAILEVELHFQGTKWQARPSVSVIHIVVSAVAAVVAGTVTAVDIAIASDTAPAAGTVTAVDTVGIVAADIISFDSFEIATDGPVPGSTDGLPA